jgi:formylglycine-generating enzyme required for sulfatase activity
MNTQNPTQIEKGKRSLSLKRMTCGGDWLDTPINMQASDRGRFTPAIRDDIIGFRLVRNK